MIKEQLVAHGFLGLQGELVDAVVFQLLHDRPDCVPEAYRAKRRDRDGHRHHITILTKSEALAIVRERAGTENTTSTVKREFVHQLLEEMQVRS
mgnify:FL=1